MVSDVSHSLHSQFVNQDMRQYMYISSLRHIVGMGHKSNKIVKATGTVDWSKALHYFHRNFAQQLSSFLLIVLDTRPFSLYNDQ